MGVLRSSLAATCSGFIVLLGLICFGAVDAYTQVNELPDASSRRGERDLEETKTVKEYLAKQRALKEKKEHEELLKRGEELVSLTGQLENAFEKNNSLTPAELVKLDSVEKLVTKIRKGLGGEGDDADELDDTSPEADRLPSSLKEAFSDLKEVTEKLVDELKKTTRFTVSAVAIQSSNSLLKIVRFLRIRR